jgi:glycerophosphoryl diester phosphodiesterase
MERTKFVGVLILLITFGVSAEMENSQFHSFRIAHAGGGLGKMTYTNSYQALNSSLENGFIYFEIDFTFTSDNQLVCLHDWGANFKRVFGFETKRRLALEEFETLAEENTKFTNCTLDGLAVWMKKNPAAHIVTDVKGDNLKALKQIHDLLPNWKNRVIPQIYDPRNFAAVQNMGFQQIIWTLYRYPGNGFNVIQWIEKWEAAVAVTMPKERAASALPRALHARGIPTYVHTVNKREERDKFITKFGVTEIYTDHLIP